MGRSGAGTSPRDRLVLAASIGIVLLTLALDLASPLGYATWLPYLLAVAIVSITESRRAIYLAATAALVLTLVPLLLDASGDRTTGTVNRVVGAGMIAVVAFGLPRIQAARNELTRGFAERQWLLVDAAPNAMLMVDAEGRIVLANSEALQLFDYASDDLVGRSVEDLVPEQARDVHPEYRRAYVAHPRRRAMGTGTTLTARRRDGSEVPVEIGLNPIRTPEGLLVLASIVDVSERLRRDELQRSLEHKDTLLKEIHHRVRNNLQVVSSLLSLQSRRLRDPEALAAFAESAERIRTISLVHEKLYRSGNLDWIDLPSYLRDLVGMITRTWGDRAGKVRTELDVEAIRADLDRAVPLGLIVSELVTNALKHAFPGGGDGSVKVSARLDGDDLVLEVRDDGVGMPAEASADGGSLGLRLVDLLAGQLRARVERPEGPGTVFRIVAPAEGARAR